MCTLLYHPVFHCFFHCTPTPQLYTLSLHDALPISHSGQSTTVPWIALESFLEQSLRLRVMLRIQFDASQLDRKSTRLNSSHLGISYAVFCLKKKTRACGIYII